MLDLSAINDYPPITGTEGGLILTVRANPALACGCSASKAIRRSIERTSRDTLKGRSVITGPVGVRTLGGAK